MANLVVSKKEIGGLYDFAVNGGVAGSIAMNVWLPGKCVVDRLWTKTITTVTSAGAATIALTFDNAGPYGMVPFPFGAFTTGTCLAGVDFNANPTLLATGIQMYFVIGTANLTAGKIAFIVEYTQMDI